MTVTQALLAFTVVAALLTVVPGMDTALVLRSTLTRSRRHGFAALAGIQVGTLLWGAAAAGGAAALLAASQTAYRVLTVVGAAYLVWMGVSMIRASLRLDGAARADAPQPAAGQWRHFGLGLGTNLLNPKVGVFYVAAIPQFTPAGVNPLLMGLLLAAVHCVLGSTWSTAVVLGAGLAGPRLRRSNAVRWLDRVTGGLLVVLGARLAVESRA